MDPRTNPATVRTSAGLIPAVSHAFTTRTRSRGVEYFSGGAVRIEGADPRTIVAAVQGSREKPYICAIDFSQVETRTRLQVECTCPHFFEGHKCKHLYASLLAIDAGGIELVPSSALESRLDVVSYEANLSKEDDWFFTGAHAAPLPQTNERPEWERKLTTLRRASGDWRGLSSVEVAIERSQRRRIAYRIDAAQSTSLSSLVLSAYELGPEPDEARPVPLVTRETQTLGDEEDRRLAQMLAASPLTSSAAAEPGANSGGQDAPTASLVPPGYHEAALLALARTGRLQIAEGQRFVTLGVDEGVAYGVRVRISAFEEPDAEPEEPPNDASATLLGEALSPRGDDDAEGARREVRIASASPLEARARSDAPATNRDDGAERAHGDAATNRDGRAGGDAATSHGGRARGDAAANRDGRSSSDASGTTNRDRQARDDASAATNHDGRSSSDASGTTNRDRHARDDASATTNHDGRSSSDASGTTNRDRRARDDASAATNHDGRARADASDATNHDGRPHAGDADGHGRACGVEGGAPSRDGSGDAHAAGATGHRDGDGGTASATPRGDARAASATPHRDGDAGATDGDDASAAARGDDVGSDNGVGRPSAPHAARELHLTADLVRGDEVVPLSAVRLALPSGFVVIDDRIARWDATAFDVVRFLTHNEAIRFGEEALPAFLDGLVEVPQLPPIELPEPWHTTVGEPRCEVAFLEPDKRGRITRGLITFHYGATRFDARSTDSGWIDEDARAFVRRDRDGELAILEQLGGLGVNAAASFEDHQIYCDTADVPRVARALLTRGFSVEAKGKRLLSLTGSDVRLTSGQDWFDLTGSFQFGEHTVELPDLLRAIRDRDGFVKLGDGTDGMLPEEWLVRFSALDKLGSKKKGKLQFASSQAALLDLLLEDDAITVDARFDALRRRLKSATGFRARREARSFEGELRQYQREGLGWLYFLQRTGLGGCLADDMGLGKTVQVLAMLEARRRLRKRTGEGRASLVVAPRSLVHNWIAETRRFTPSLKIGDYTGPDRWQVAEDIDAYDIIITTYGTVRRDIERLREHRFDYVVLDEAQAIKNASSLASKACRVLQADHRLALSGTPVENHLLELWSIFEFLNPKMLGSRREFGRLVKDKDGRGLELIARGLRPMILRRTKNQVLAELPEKTELTLYVQQDEDERRLYDELLGHYRSSLKQRIETHGFDKSRIHVLEALLRLRQAACHPGLLDDKRKKKGSAKLDTLVEQLREVTEEGHKALVFSQFVQLLQLVKQRLDKESIRYAYLDGSTKNRAEVVSTFQNDEACEVFLISLKAGGFGLNLTAADYVFILDPWWNPAVETQAIDRAHRIGQERPVFAYRLITAGTVEEKILELHAKKRALADAVIDASNHLTGALTLEDLELLLM
ncbi:MAG: SNF2-related protein [Deltaproteobacteria bacterium]